MYRAHTAKPAAPVARRLPRRSSAGPRASRISASAPQAERKGMSYITRAAVRRPSGSDDHLRPRGAARPPPATGGSRPAPATAAGGQDGDEPPCSAGAVAGKPTVPPVVRPTAVRAPRGRSRVSPARGKAPRERPHARRARSPLRATRRSSLPSPEEFMLCQEPAQRERQPRGEAARQQRGGSGRVRPGGCPVTSAPPLAIRIHSAKPAQDPENQPHPGTDAAQRPRRLQPASQPAMVCSSRMAPPPARPALEEPGAHCWAKAHDQSQPSPMPKPSPSNASAQETLALSPGGSWGVDAMDTRLPG